MKSLELNWIRNVDKSLVMPEVVFDPSLDCSGRYFHPDDDWEYYDDSGRPHDMTYGVIVVNPTMGDVEVPRTIAHEWRHHWQLFHNWKYDGESVAWGTVTDEDYDKEIYRYFTKSKSEMDAVMFECKHTGILDSWYEILYDHLKQI